ncbi:MAG: L-histidine N(alpha)-methyltransferase [Desulfobacterales bacterium]|nr:L-histidine N(alpha)-methyltransferase [Desulfobacterales bacterium]
MHITKTESKRYTLFKTDCESDPYQFAQRVKQGLTSSPKFFLERDVFDSEGSLLFEKICQAPEYYVARAEAEILSENASEIVTMLPENIMLVELGSGNSEKTRQLIEALLNRQAHLKYAPIDISCTMLDNSAQALIRKYPRLDIAGAAATYHDGLNILKENMGSSPKLILWLGSTIGDLCRKEAVDFLKTVRTTVMTDQDAMLVGIDLKKDRAILEAAYNDSHGSHNRLAKNILKRINSELGGHFIPASFDYQAVYNETKGCIDINLISTKAQQVQIDALDLKVDFDKGEAVHGHNAHKYSKDDIFILAENSGMKLSGQWTDTGNLCSLNLFSPNTNS